MSPSEDLPQCVLVCELGWIRAGLEGCALCNCNACGVGVGGVLVTLWSSCHVQCVDFPWAHLAVAMTASWAMTGWAEELLWMWWYLYETLSSCVCWPSPSKVVLGAWNDYASYLCVALPHLP